MLGRGILFVSHDASRTGAPIGLLHFLRWFKRNGNRPFSILLGGGGELLADFGELADTWSMERSRWQPNTRWAKYLVAAGLGKWAHRAESADARRFVAKRLPGLIYANSIATARLVEVLAPDAPVLTHVHELEFHFRTYRSSELSFLLAKTRQFIACSNAVRHNLVREHGVTEAQVETVHESIPVDQVRAQRSRQQVLEELRIPGDALLVAGGGAVTWHKGSDLFIQLARAVCQKRSVVYFAWIGGGLPREVAQLEHDVRLSGLMEKMRFTGAVAKPADYLAAADVFVLTSREDSYPFMCLEAAALGKPIICFAEAGGAPEFVEEDCGFVVPYLDITAMADRLVSLLDLADCRLRLGAAARGKVVQRHDISSAAPRIMEIIERTIVRTSDH